MFLRGYVAHYDDKEKLTIYTGNRKHLRFMRSNVKLTYHINTWQNNLTQFSMTWHSFQEITDVMDAGFFQYRIIRAQKKLVSLT